MSIACWIEFFSRLQSLHYQVGNFDKTVYMDKFLKLQIQYIEDWKVEPMNDDPKKEQGHRIQNDVHWG